MISTECRRQAAVYRDRFATARPFPHVVIDGFFDVEVAERLLADFPAFERRNAVNEFGEVGRKATVPAIARISPAYAGVFDFLASGEFLGFVSELTGIPDLVHDAEMFGGGTHENLEGQELDPHVDFNFLRDLGLHRRLNLLLYLNKEWDDEWGGSLELHSNPRRPEENQVRVITPLFNRGVIFETSERSWHGFRRIRLPEGRKHLSRKLLSVYLYTRERPADQRVPPHGTFYVQRPLPAQLVPGRSLSAEDIGEVEALLTRRDEWIEFYQRKELEDSRTIEERSRWAHGLEGELHTARERLERLRSEFDERGRWAQGLEAELHSLREQTAVIRKELEETESKLRSPAFLLRRLAACVFGRRP